MDVRFGLHSRLKSDSGLLNYSVRPERFRVWMLKFGCTERGSDK